VECVRRYCELTKTLRLDNHLFISTVVPHQAVKSETISRWVRDTLGEAGVDIVTFSGHSTRAASTSCAKAQGLSIREIREAAGWTNSKTFARFYDKPIAQNFGETVLSCLD
jgi:integrase